MKKIIDEKTFLINLPHFRLGHFWTIQFIKRYLNKARFRKSTPLAALSVSFQNLVSNLNTYQDVHEVGWSRLFFFCNSFNFAIIGSLQCIPCFN